MAGRSHLQITLPLPLLLPKPEVGAVSVLQQTTVSQSAKTIVCLPVGIHPDRPSALRLEDGAWWLASRAMESTKRNHLIEATAAAGQLWLTDWLMLADYDLAQLYDYNKVAEAVISQWLMIVAEDRGPTLKAHLKSCVIKSFEWTYITAEMY